jgi:hypothetical protein
MGGRLAKRFLAVNSFIPMLAVLWAPALAADPLLDKVAREPLPEAVWVAMQGKSYNNTLKACAQRGDLVLLTLPYWDYENRAQLGQLIVHASVGDVVRQIFVDLYTDKSYRIQSMQLIDVYGGNDDASMDANNTSAYNCRRVAGGGRLSSHARGLAIDVNPLVNPFVWKKGTSPKGGAAWDTPAERKAARKHPGMILPDSAIVKAFKAKGWGWGGDWKGSKDYQHFSADGR